MRRAKADPEPGSAGDERRLTSASSDVISLVRSQSARKRVTNHVRGAHV